MWADVKEPNDKKTSEEVDVENVVFKTFKNFLHLTYKHFKATFLSWRGIHFHGKSVVFEYFATKQF